MDDMIFMCETVFCREELFSINLWARLARQLGHLEVGSNMVKPFSGSNAKVIFMNKKKIKASQEAYNNQSLPI